MSRIDDLIRTTGEWLRGDGPMSDVVVSSRIRLARNLAGRKFLSRADEQEREDICRLLSEQISRTPLGERSFIVDMEEAEELDRLALVERHLISRQHADAHGSRAAFIGADETWALMINEEDHLRIQVLRSGAQLDVLWEQINEIDDVLERRVDYAFDPRYGYLTACPTNVGTGIRVSIMLHLPGLKLTQEIEKVARAAKDMRLAVRGLYGEGTDAVGDLFQISNQVTLGQSERDIVREFVDVVIPNIVEYELAARRMLATERSTMLDDKVWRAYGLLENARAVSSEETLYLLSHLRLGVCMGRLPSTDMRTVNELMLMTQPAHLQKLHGSAMSVEQRNQFRAQYLRRRLASDN